MSDNLNNHPEEYHQRFLTLMDYGLRSREHRYKEDAIKMFDKLQLESCDEVRVLSVGSGNGDVDLHFINALVDKYPTIHYTVVEPAIGPIDEFKRLIKSNKDEWNGVTFIFHVQGINEYLEAGGTSDKYEFIHACHSFYHFRDVGSTLYCLYNMLSKNGFLLVRAAKDGGWWKYCKYIKKFQSDQLPVTGIDVKNLIKLQMPDAHIEATSHTHVVTVTKCFDKDSKDGNEMLDFINTVLNFRSCRPPDEVEVCLKYFRDECCYAKEGEIMFDCVEENIISS